MKSIPQIPWLTQYIEDYVIEVFNKQVDERRILPGQISVHYLEFEQMFMSQYDGNEFVEHKTIRELLKWVYQVITVTNDPTEVITAIKFISPNIEALDSRTMAAVCQSLILTGTGVAPTINANPNLLPYEVGYDLTSNLVRGQLAYNITDNIWYYRKAGTPDTIVDIRTGLGLRISDITDLQETLESINTIYSFKKPLFVTSPEVIAYNANTYYNIGNFVTYGGKTYTCQDLPGLATAEDFIPGYNYADQDMVIYEGELFTCIQDGTGGVLPTDISFWAIGQHDIAPTGHADSETMWREQPAGVSPKLVDIKIDSAVLAVDALGRLTVVDGAGNFLSTVIPQDFINSNLVNNVLIIDHGKETLNVDVLIWDNNGNRIPIIPKVVNENRVTVDLGSPIDGTWRYILQYWKDQSIGVYPDPIYALASHNHDGTYAAASHNHDGTYAPFSHSHSEYAASNHNHTNVYAASSHNHNDLYSLLAHTHVKSDPVFSDSGKDIRVTLGVNSIQRDGNVISGYIVARCTVANTQVKIGIIDAANRPSGTRNFIGSPETGSVWESARGQVQPNGDINVWFGNINHNFYFPITYIV